MEWILPIPDEILPVAVIRSFPLMLVAVAVLAAPVAAVNEPTPPDGVWYMNTTRASYAGPPMPVRAAVMKLIERRISFTPACTMTVCSATAHVTQVRPRREVAFGLKPAGEGFYTGRVAMKTWLRCGSRSVKVTLALTVKMTDIGQERRRLAGTTDARALNPGRCARFRGYARAVRKMSFVGALTP